MKLALIRRRFSAVGGAELYVQRLLGALLAQGHEIHLFSEDWPDLPGNMVFHRQVSQGGRAQRPLLFARAVQRGLAQSQFDCVLSFERTLGQDVYRAGDGVHRVWLDRRREFAVWWRKPWVGWGGFHRTMLRLESETFNPANTRHIIVNSLMVKGEIIEHFDFPADRIHLIRNGIDVRRFQGGNRAATRARFGVDEKDYLLLFVGSGWERKGLKFLKQAVIRLLQQQAQGSTRWAEVGTATASSEPKTQLKLLVVGKGKPPRGWPAEIIFAAPLGDIQDAYAAADLFVFLPIYEPSANVCIEALAAGLPVVTSAQNGAGECIQERVTGTVLPDPRDTDKVARAIDFWRRQGPVRLSIDTAELDLDRNVRETMRILELAAAEVKK